MTLTRVETPNEVYEVNVKCARGAVVDSIEHLADQSYAVYLADGRQIAIYDAIYAEWRPEAK